MKRNRLVAVLGLVFCAALTGFIVSNAEAARPIGPIACGPKYCLDVWDPVICSNGVVYSNACYAARACATGCGPVTY